MMEVRDELKGVHPFFGKRIKAHADLPGVNPETFSTKPPSIESIAMPKEKNEMVRPGRKKVGQPSPDKTTKANTRRVSSKTAGENTAELFEVDPNLVRRKRHKSRSPGDEKHGNERLDALDRTVPSLVEGRNALSGTNLVSALNFDDHDVKGFGPQRKINLTTSTTPTSPSTPYGIVRHWDGQTPPAPICESASTTSTSIVTLNGLANDGGGLTSRPSTINSPKASATKPQKTLRLNAKTGTIGSPPAKKPARASDGTGPKKKSGKFTSQSKSVIVTVKYGHDRDSRSTVGQNIDDVLSGLKSFPFLLKPPQKPPKSVAQAGVSKSTHPFFLGKVSPKAVCSENAEHIAAEVVKEEKPTKPKSSMTLGEARSHSPTKRKIQATSIGAFQNFGNTSKIMKFPGALEACWPPKDMVHVRGPDGTASSSQLAQITSLSRERKSKYAATVTLAKDDILMVLATKLDVNNVLKKLECISAEDFAEPEKTLRVPLKHFENGIQIQRRVRRELSVKIPLNTQSEKSSDSEDELHGDGRKIAQIHPALLRIYKSLPSSLTAFDRSQYETQSWIQKYSPCTAAEVLQCGKEAFILKEWLQSLTIIAVDPVTSDVARSRATSVASRRYGMSKAEKSGKKKRKANKLDGFVISSEEEENEMDEISDQEDDEGSYRLTKRTVVRSVDIFNKSSRESNKLKNTIVISGPSGCGKTAMVYGVAKELGFEIFEINSSSRRSGKEILERVGDMTRNHLVHRSDHLDASGPQEESHQHVFDASSADLKSGRQGTMSSFFKPTKTANPITKSTTLKVTKKDTSDKVAKLSKAPPKQQTQSLILFEEVDVLFEEDKQFWTTVMTLIAQSKRPIIMTCNDETLLPLQVLELHAIIRLSPPPSNIAIDYMLLVAAAEGHIIKRRAVKALYEARQSDLRAALTELDYWCQLGIGDRKGGLDWFYPRWPPGCDLDGDGHQVRVVSEGTYKTGMGWLGRDSIFERHDKPEVNEEVLREAWDGWNIDIGDWHESLDTESLLEYSTGDSLRSALYSYEAFVESMSAADICASSSFATGNQVLLDTGAPLITAKARDDFVIGCELLQASTMVSYDTLDKELAFSIMSQAQQSLQYQCQARFEAPSEAQIIGKIATFNCRKDDSIYRQDFSIAFDSIAEPERNTDQGASSLEPSVFDRATATIAVDVAPYIRSIVAYDAKLQQERARLSNLLSEGGRKGKRLRTTRSALSALEGGTRKTTRPEKYFRVPINPHLVCRTGLQSWRDAVSAEMSDAEARGAPSVADGLDSNSPGMTDSS